MSLNIWVQEQERRGRISFSVEGLRKVFPDRPDSILKTDLRRLYASGKIQLAYKGFYVIVPTQYQLKGVVPPTYYINDLMAYLQKPYYVGLLSAAAMHGAAHQRMMETLIVTIPPRSRTLRDNLIRWNYRQRIPSNLLITKNAEMGIIKYSCPELTAADLVQFAANIGGYGRAATVLAELMEAVDINRMSAVFPYTSIAAMQRLGYILEYVLYEQEKADMFYSMLREKKTLYNTIPLSPKLPVASTDHNRWRVNPNIKIEIDDL